MGLASEDVTIIALRLSRVRLAAEIVLADSRLTRWGTAVARAAQRYGWTEEAAKEVLETAQTLSRMPHDKNSKLGRAVRALESRRARHEEGK